MRHRSRHKDDHSQSESILKTSSEFVSIIELFLKQVSLRPDSAAIFHREGPSNSQRHPPAKIVSVSWSELAQSVGHLCAVLNGLDIGRGDRVVNVSENRLEWIELDLALQFIGAIHVPLNPRLNAVRLGQIIDRCQPKAVIAESREFSDQVCEKTIGGKTGRSRLDFYHWGSENSADLNCLNAVRKTISWKTIHSSELHRLRDSNCPDDLMTILYTSGTTGIAKAVPLTYQNIASNTVSLSSLLPVAPSGQRMNFLPLSHVFARTCDWYASIANGCAMGLAHAQNAISDCRDFQPTFINGVPHFYEKVRAQVQREGCELRELLGNKIQTCNSGGATLDDSLFRYFWDHNVPMVCGYGLTETSPVIATMDLDHVRKGTVGKPLSNLKIKLASDGELLVRGPSVFSGYLDDTELNSESFDETWFRTGDIVSLDPDNYLTILGRKREFIALSNGYKANPVPIELLIDKLDWVEKSVVVGEGQKSVGALILPAEPIRTGNQEIELEVAKAEVIAATSELPDFEQVRKIELVTTPFDSEHGLATTKGTLRRTEIASFYRDKICELFSEVPKPSLSED